MAINKAFEAALKAISYHQLDIKRSYQLQRTLGKVGKFTLFRPTVKMTDSEIVCSGSVVPVRTFLPHNNADNTDLIIFFHGGGWVTGDIDSYNRVCAVTARQTGCRVASVDYRLAPEHPYPAGLQDCYEVARYFFWNAEELFGISSKRIILMGDSAGGNLAAAVSLMARDKGEFMPRRQILIYPATYFDHTKNSPYPSVVTNGTDYVLTAERIEEYMDLYKSKSTDKYEPYFSPLLAKDFSRQPDTLVVTAQYDPLRDEGEDYGQKLRDAGSYVEIYRMMNALHGFFSLPAGVHQVKKCYDMINSFFK